MDVQLTQSMDLEEYEEFLDRRTVVRALTDARRRLEDERGVGSNFIDPRADMLIAICADMHLTTIEAVEVLGFELVIERLMMKHLHDDLPIPEWQAWMDAHKDSTIATLAIPGGLQ